MAENRQVILRVTGIKTDEDVKKIEESVFALENVNWCSVEKKTGIVKAMGDYNLSKHDVAIGVLLAGDYKITNLY